MAGGFRSSGTIASDATRAVGSLPLKGGGSGWGSIAETQARFAMEAMLMIAVSVSVLLALGAVALSGDDGPDRFSTA